MQFFHLSLNDDVFYLIALELCQRRDDACGQQAVEARTSLVHLASASRSLRAIVLPLLFKQVSWPHKQKADDVSGLHFFPETLWRYFRRFHLIWPHEWLDTFPPKWGDYGADPYSQNYYVPRHLSALLSALPHLPLTHFTLRCPFVPPPALLSSLFHSPTLTTLAIEDTPLDGHIPPNTTSTAPLTALTLGAVGEAIRIGDGRVDPRIADNHLWVRGWKKRYRASRALRLPSEARTAAALLAVHASHLHTLTLSGELCVPSRMAACEWPELHSFILTGHAPDPLDGTPLCAVLARMPCLQDLRLLLVALPDRGLLRLFPPSSPIEPPSTLTHLALSTACDLHTPLVALPSLHTLALISISDWPRVPIALSLPEATRALHAVGSGLRRLRVMIEDKLTPAFCWQIARHLPALESLEAELCGYHDGKTVFEWEDFASALASLNSLRFLRLCVQFPEFDDSHDGEHARGPWYDARHACANFFARSLPSLVLVGFEFRHRTGTHKYQDAWLEFDVVREERIDATMARAGAFVGGNGGGTEKCAAVDGEKDGIEVVALPQLRHYMFPEVWDEGVW